MKWSFYLLLLVPFLVSHAKDVSQTFTVDVPLGHAMLLEPIVRRLGDDYYLSTLTGKFDTAIFGINGPFTSQLYGNGVNDLYLYSIHSDHSSSEKHVQYNVSITGTAGEVTLRSVIGIDYANPIDVTKCTYDAELTSSCVGRQWCDDPPWYEPWKHRQCWQNQVVCGGHFGDCPVMPPYRLFCAENKVRNCQTELMGTIRNHLDVTLRSTIKVYPTTEGALGFKVVEQTFDSVSHKESADVGVFSQLPFNYSTSLDIVEKTKASLTDSVSWFATYTGTDFPALPVLTSKMLASQRATVMPPSALGTALTLNYQFTDVVSSPYSYMIFVMGKAACDLTTMSKTTWVPTECQLNAMPPTDWTTISVVKSQKGLRVVSGLRLSKALFDAALWVIGNAGVFHEDAKMKILDANIHFSSNLTLPTATFVDVNRISLTTKHGSIQANCTADDVCWKPFVNATLSNISVFGSVDNIVDRDNADNVSFCLHIDDIHFQTIQLDKPALPLPSRSLASIGEKMVNLTRDPLNRELQQRSITFPPPSVARAPIIRAPRATTVPFEWSVPNKTSVQFGYIEVVAFCDMLNGALSDFPPCSDYMPTPPPPPPPTLPPPPPPTPPPALSFNIHLYESSFPCNINTTGDGVAAVSTTGSIDGMCRTMVTVLSTTWYWRLDSSTSDGLFGAFMCSSPNCQASTCEVFTAVNYGVCYQSLVAGNASWSLQRGASSSVCSYNPLPIPKSNDVNVFLTTSPGSSCGTVLSHRNLGPSAPTCFLNSSDLTTSSGPFARVDGVPDEWLADSCYHQCCGNVPDDHCNRTVPRSPGVYPSILCEGGKFVANSTCVNVSSVFQTRYFHLTAAAEICQNNTAPSVPTHDEPAVSPGQIVLIVLFSVVGGGALALFSFMYVFRREKLNQLWVVVESYFALLVVKPVESNTQRFSEWFTRYYDDVSTRLEIWWNSMHVARPSVRFHIADEWEHTAVMVTCATCFFSLAITWSLFNPFMRLLDGDTRSIGLPANLRIDSTDSFFKDWNYYGIFVCQIGIIASFVMLIVPMWLRQVERRDDGSILYKTIGSAKFWATTRAFVVTALLMMIGGVITIPPFFMDIKHAVVVGGASGGLITDPSTLDTISLLLSMSLSMFTLPLVLHLLLYFFSGISTGIFVGVILRHFSNQRYREAGEGLDSALLDQNQVSLIHMLACALLPTFEIFVVMAIFQAVDTPLVMLALWMTHALMSYATVPCLAWLFRGPDRMNKHSLPCALGFLIIHLIMIGVIAHQPCRLFEHMNFFICLNVSTMVLCVLVLVSLRRTIVVEGAQSPTANQNEDIFTTLHLKRRTLVTAPKWVPKGSFLRWLFQSEEIENWRHYGYRLWWRRFAIILATGCVFVVLSHMYDDVHNDETRKTIVDQLETQGIKDASNATALFDAAITVYHDARQRQFYATIPCAVFLCVALISDAFFPSRVTLWVSSVACQLCFLESLIALLFVTLPDYVGGSKIEQYLPDCAPEFNSTMMWAARTLVSLIFSAITLSNIIPVLIFFPPTAVRVLGLVARDQVLQDANGRLLLLFVSFLTPVVVSLPLVVLYQVVRDSMLLYLCLAVMGGPLVIGFLAQHIEAVSFMKFFYLWMGTYTGVWLGVVYRVCTLESTLWEYVMPILQSADFYCSVLLEVALTSVTLTDVMLGLVHTADELTRGGGGDSSPSVLTLASSHAMNTRDGVQLVGAYDAYMQDEGGVEASQEERTITDSERP
eukprot:PhM_4_TR17524/c0_g1_i1/m.25739